MNKIILIITAIIFVSQVCCQKENTIQDKTLLTKNIVFSDCINHSKSTKAEEYIEFNTIDSNYMEVKHFNINLNCCPDSILVNSRIEDGNIIYSICHNFPHCNCDCPHDVTCVIGPLDYSIYNFKILVCGEEVKYYKINFNKSTSVILQ